jgi:hypothetical protein
MSSKNVGFSEFRRNPPSQRGYSDGFTPMLEVDGEACSSTQTHGRNRRKTPQITRSKIGPKIPLKIMKMKNIATQNRR